MFKVEKQEQVAVGQPSKTVTTIRVFGLLLYKHVQWTRFVDNLYTLNNMPNPEPFPEVK